MIIYLILNTLNGKGYVGLTTRTLEKRWREHCIGDKLLVDKAIFEFGEKNFEISALEETDNLIDLNKLEKDHIKKQGTLTPNGYNISEGGSGHSKSGKGRPQILPDRHLTKYEVTRRYRRKHPGSRKWERRRYRMRKRKELPKSKRLHKSKYDTD